MIKKQLTDSGVEVVKSSRRSPFDLKNTGAKQDSTKSYRWVDPSRIEERKNADGFTFTKRSDGSSGNDGTIRTKGNMVLMERSRDRDEEVRREKEALTRSKTRSTREDLGRVIEELSVKHGQDLHKHFRDEED
jgi:hypothetical protein